MASEGQRLKSRSSAWLRASRCRRAKALEITGAAAAAQNPQHRHQQQEPLRVTHPAAVAANSFGEGFAYGDGLEEADQVIRNSLIDYSKTGFGHWTGEIPPTKPNADRPAKAYADRLLGDPAEGLLRRPWKTTCIKDAAFASHAISGRCSGEKMVIQRFLNSWPMNNKKQ